MHGEQILDILNKLNEKRFFNCYVEAPKKVNGSKSASLQETNLKLTKANCELSKQTKILNLLFLKLLC